jgi:predicted permease
VLFWNVFTQVLLPILLMFGCGWILDRRFNLDLSTLVKLNIHLVVPAFMFYEVVSCQLGAADSLRIVGFTLLIVATMYFLSHLVSWGLNYPDTDRRSLQMATMFYNSGNYGIPLMTLAFPGTGPLLQVFVVLAQNVSLFSVGILLSASGPHSGWRNLLPMLRQVSLWAVSAALLVRWMEVPVKEYRWVWVPVEYFHNALVGVALVSLGAQLSQTRARQNLARLSWALTLRLLGGPMVAFLLVRLFGFHGETAAVLIVSSAFPTAVNTAMLAHEFDADSQFASAAVFYSTLLSMFTVSVMIVILKFPGMADWL